MKHKWISVQDRLPEKMSGYTCSERVLVFSDTQQRQRIEGCWYPYIGDITPRFQDDITHWQPLPANPIGIVEVGLGE